MTLRSALRPGDIGALVAMHGLLYAGYRSVILWTVSALTTAARLYRAAGFVKTYEHACNQWGVDVVEEKYELQL